MLRPGDAGEAPSLRRPQTPPSLIDMQQTLYPSAVPWHSRRRGLRELRWRRQRMARFPRGMRLSTSRSGDKNPQVKGTFFSEEKEAKRLFSVSVPQAPPAAWNGAKVFGSFFQERTPVAAYIAAPSRQPRNAWQLALRRAEPYASLPPEAGHLRRKPDVTPSSHAGDSRRGAAKCTQSANAIRLCDCRHRRFHRRWKRAVNCWIACPPQTAWRSSWSSTSIPTTKA